MQYNIYYFSKNKKETMAIIVHKNEVNDDQGQFVRIYKQFMRDGWSIQEIVKTKKEPKSLHPQTGEEI